MIKNFSEKCLFKNERFSTFKSYADEYRKTYLRKAFAEVNQKIWIKKIETDAETMKL